MHYKEWPSWLQSDLNPNAPRVNVCPSCEGEMLLDSPGWLFTCKDCEYQVTEAAGDLYVALMSEYCAGSNSGSELPIPSPAALDMLYFALQETHATRTTMDNPDTHPIHKAVEALKTQINLIYYPT